MLTNHLVRDLDDHDLSVLHTRNTQNGLVGVACVNPLQKKIRGPLALFFRGTKKVATSVFNMATSGNRIQVERHLYAT